jgi:hypothetical protein
MASEKMSGMNPTTAPPESDVQLGGAGISLRSAVMPDHTAHANIGAVAIEYAIMTRVRGGSWIEIDGLPVMLTGDIGRCLDRVIEIVRER